VHVQVDQAGSYHLARRLEQFGVIGPAEVLAHRLDPAILDEQVGHFVDAAIGVEHAAAADQDRSRAHSAAPGAVAQSGAPPASR
jgi:hypothetical protein